MIFSKKLPNVEKASFQEALDKLKQGDKPIAALRYERLSESSRVPGKDYVLLPGVEPDVHIGFIVGIRTSKDKNSTVLLRDLCRANGRVAGETNLRVDRVISFTLICYPPRKQARE